MHLELNAEDGARITDLSYDADIDTFIGTLTDAFGGAPSIEENAAGHEWEASTDYSWPGVTIRDDHERQGVSIDMNVMVYFTHPIVAGGVSVETSNGFRPGDSLPAFADELGVYWPDKTEAPHHSFPAETGPDLAPKSELYDWANAYAVAVNNFPGLRGQETAGSAIQAPWNFGVGHV